MKLDLNEQWTAIFQSVTAVIISNRNKLMLNITTIGVAWRSTEQNLKIAQRPRRV